MPEKPRTGLSSWPPGHVKQIKQEANREKYSQMFTNVYVNIHIYIDILHVLNPSRPRTFGGKKQASFSNDQISMKYTVFLLNSD